MDKCLVCKNELRGKENTNPSFYISKNNNVCHSISICQECAEKHLSTTILTALELEEVSYSFSVNNYIAKRDGVVNE